MSRSAIESEKGFVILLPFDDFSSFYSFQFTHRALMY
jgi:hypothetical protein